MSELLTTGASERTRTPTWIWLLVALAIAVVLAANAHLVYVATMSEPACVDHLGPGKAKAERGQFSAAQSSCSSTGDTP
jgi:anti-sigma-K factor RskA